MALSGHRRTSSDKRRRAAHFALTPTALATDKAGNTHRPHRVAPNATEYRGIKIHRKGLERKLEKAVARSRSQAHDHSHEGHDHSHDHAEETKN